MTTTVDHLTTPQSALFSLPAGNGFDGLEVHTVAVTSDFSVQLHDPYDPGLAGEIVWTLYGHVPGQGLECIGDFKSFEAACEPARRLGGVPV